MKSNQSLRNITIAAIKRHTIKPYNFQYTRFYEYETITDLRHIILTDFTFQTDELPIMSVIQNENNWWLLTTNQIIGRLNESYLDFMMRKILGIKRKSTKNIPLHMIKYIEWNDFKGYKKQKIERIDVHMENNCIEYLFIETGAASMIPIYGFDTLQQLNK